MKGNKEASLMSRSINKKLSELCESPSKRSIYKVNNQYLHNNNYNKVFEPGVVAIGAYHRGKQGLAMMEEHKLRYLKSLLLRKGHKVERYISAAAEMEQEARSCYAEAIALSSAEFIEMLVLDACFIVELLRRSADDDHHNDPIFEMRWFLCILQYDLVLFENQIPFFVLCKMFDLIHDEEPNQHQVNLISVFRRFIFGAAGDHEIIRDDSNPQEVRHLLHLLHIFYRPSSSSDVCISLNVVPCSNTREFRLIPTATELRDANVSFRKSEEGETDFKNGVLTMAPLAIDDKTESFFRNSVVYEQYFPDGKPTYVTDYVLLLDCLIRTGRDVEILSECGIIENSVGDNQVAADIVNRLTHSLVLLSDTHFIYGDAFSRINAHYKKRWNRARAALNRDYLNTPWAYISFAAAVFLLLLTLAQTVFSALQLS